MKTLVHGLKDGLGEDRILRVDAIVDLLDDLERILGPVKDDMVELASEEKEWV
jgi:hypothetical protein